MITLDEQYLEAHGDSIGKSKQNRAESGQYGQSANKNIKPTTTHKW